MRHPDIVENSSNGGRTFCVRTEAGQGTTFTMHVDANGYLTGIVCPRTTVRRGQTECGLIYLVYGGDDEGHRVFALYLEVDSECRWHRGSGMLSAHIEVFASSILCMIGEVVEQTFKVEVEVACDTTPADFAPRFSDDGGSRWPHSSCGFGSITGCLV